MNAERIEQVSESLSHDATAEAIAQELSAPLGLVQRIYQEEYAHLSANARLRQFLGILASSRAKQRLRANGHGHRK